MLFLFPKFDRRGGDGRVIEVAPLTGVSTPCFSTGDRSTTGPATRETIFRSLELVAAFVKFRLGASGEVFADCLDVGEGAINRFGAVEVFVGFFRVNETLLDDFEVFEALFAASIDTTARFGAVEGLEEGFLTEAVSPLASERMDRKDILSDKDGSVERVYCCWDAM